MYEGAEKPTSAISTVRLWNPSVGVIKIDNKPGMSNGRESHAFITPGTHEFTVVYLFANTYTTPVSLKATTLAGHTYTFGHKLSKNGVVSFFIQDRGTSYDPACLVPKTIYKDPGGVNC